MALISEAHWFARPHFRVMDSRWASPCQADFSPYSYRWISDPPKSTFGRPCYLFEGVAPHPNCPPTVVHANVLAVRAQKGGVSSASRNRPSGRPCDESRLRYTSRLIRQRQAAVKLHGVFAFRWTVLDCAPVSQFHRLPGGDSSALVGPSCKSPIKRQGITLP